MLGRFSFIWFLFFRYYFRLWSDNWIEVDSLPSMFVGYFRFELEGNPRIGYFRLLEGHQFYSVWLFSSVAKVTDRNDPAYVVDKPQLRYVPELLLECFRTYATDFIPPPIYSIPFIRPFIFTLPICRSSICPLPICLVSFYLLSLYPQALKYSCFHFYW